MNTVTRLHTTDTMTAAPHPLRSAVTAEWIKIRSIRTTPALVALTGVIGVGMALILGLVVKEDPYEHLPFTIANTFLVSTWLTTLLSVVAGTLLFTSEVQHGTLAGLLTARPSKRIVIGAKALTAAALGFVMGAVGIVGSLVAGIAGGLDGGDFAGAVSGTVWALLLTSLAAVFGVGIGLIVRHSAAAVTGLLVWATAAENLLRGMAPANVSRLMPFSAATGLLGTRQATDSKETLAAAFSNAGNAALFAGYAVAALAAGAWLLSRRDV